MKHLQTYKLFENKQHLILYENYVAEMSTEDTKNWALFAHVADFFAKADSESELQRLFQKAKQNTEWPRKVVEFFYKWYKENKKELA